MNNQRLLPYVVEVMDKPEGITAWAGLPSVLDAMRALRLDESVRDNIRVRKRHRGYSESQKVEALVLLMAAGGECVDDIQVLKADAGLCRLVGDLPSADALLKFLYAFHDESLIEKARAQWTGDRVAFIPEENKALQGLGEINKALVHRVAAQGSCRRIMMRPSRKATSARPSPITREVAGISLRRSTGRSRTWWLLTNIGMGMFRRRWRICG